VIREREQKREKREKERAKEKRERQRDRERGMPIVSLSAALTADSRVLGSITDPAACISLMATGM
jgi:chromatin remodeling complex protein RSC6